MGDFVFVVIDVFENGYGDMILLCDKVKCFVLWLLLEKVFDNNEFVIGMIIGKVKGGMIVMVNGICVFLLGLLVDMCLVKDMILYEGKMFEFCVIKFDCKCNNVVLLCCVVIEVI